MISIPLKTVNVEVDGKTIGISYRLQLQAILKQPPTLQGSSIDEVRRAIHVLDAIEKCDGKVLNLEDADFEFMKQRVLATRWPFVDQAILKFVEDVTEGK